MKKHKEIKSIDSPLFDKVLTKDSDSLKKNVSNSLAIANQIVLYLDAKKMLQRDLAKLMHKTEPEISKWLSGFHNFTIETITSIEIALNEKIILTPSQIKEVHEQEVIHELGDSKLDGETTVAIKDSDPTFVIDADQITVEQEKPGKQYELLKLVSTNQEAAVS